MGWQVKVQALGAGFPHPSTAELREAAQVLGGVPAGRTLVIDGLALGAMPAVVEACADRLDLVALIHHPLALETGLASAEAQRLRNSEQRALGWVRKVITTSASTARALDAYEVAQERLVVVPPGTDPAPLAKGSRGPDLNLLCVATLTPRKGHAVLFEALSRIRDLPWRLTCIGSTTRDAEQTAVLEAAIATLGLGDRVRLAGELDAACLDAEYDAADAFVLASFHEGYGMVLAEALARGLPVVSTTAGAIPQTLPEAAALLVPPGNVEALAAALRTLIEDRPLRASLAAGARAARAGLPSWESACHAFAAAVGQPGRACA
ncbi:glycosyltransferase family 4 protein [Thiorhodococcus mannitoliphagus]|uniref:Glycosyltransferase family 4 protein n=2 Tax=Thiorhodococcus mannitoliphagus TaxID=329406 RepID=A0A6P1DPY2_9GAMM|nr:glycosyltransferase family 4 protein [Thiorhodococcus mannitoliphagus]